MRTVTVKAGKGYEVRIGRGLLPEIGKQIGVVPGVRRVLVVSDDRVFPLYGETVLKSLADAGYETDSFVFANGEASKNLTVYGELLTKLCDAGITRDDLLVAL
ncbi:MAG: 3-dehydroquinate synthase, partial [Lachnospiraceae bacterium]|nr:3-dehydroquinate synthase [Lachnospiraceae bacterium]